MGPHFGPPDPLGLLQAMGNAAVRSPYSHPEGPLLLYGPDAAPVERCLLAAVTAAQDEPSVAPWLGPAAQHTHGSMQAAAVEKLFDHLHMAHKSLARVVGLQHPSHIGLDPPEKDPPESRKRLQTAVLRYEALAVCASAAYQTNAALEGIHSVAAVWLVEALRNAASGFHATEQGQLQGELELLATALEEDLRLCALLTSHRKCAIRDFWRRNAQDISATVEGRAANHGGAGAGSVGLVDSEGPEHPKAPD